MRTIWVLDVILCIQLIVCSNEYAPNVEFGKCGSNDMQLTLSGAANGGIIYIRGGKAACVHETTNGTTFHVFQFDACGIDPYEEYYLCVQRNSLYQTMDDLELRIACYYDLSDISRVNVRADSERNDDLGINKTVRPSVIMKLYKDGYDVSGSEVKLGDPITMFIEMAEDFKDDFDFKVRQCSASTIPITDTYCACEPEVFPDFERLGRGVMTSSFNVFRTTTLTNTKVTMTFSCTLELCFGGCVDVTCGTRRKRYAVSDKSRVKRDMGKTLGHTYIGNRYIVSKPTYTPHSVDPDELCMHAFVVYLVPPVVALLTLTFVTYSVYLRKKNNQQMLIVAGPPQDTKMCEI